MSMLLSTSTVWFQSWFLKIPVVARPVSVLVFSPQEKTETVLNFETLTVGAIAELVKSEGFFILSHGSLLIPI